eukprot:11046350-Lingulodinium_polyedra.AAC.1
MDTKSASSPVKYCVPLRCKSRTCLQATRTASAASLAHSPSVLRLPACTVRIPKRRLSSSQHSRNNEKFGKPEGACVSTTRKSGAYNSRPWRSGDCARRLLP